MSFFERPDPRVLQSADPSLVSAVARAVYRHALAFATCVVGVALAYAANVEAGLHAASTTHGSVLVAGLREPVTIVRDRRDVPHISARNEHDLFFAEGYVQGSDRLFQLDLTRRYAYGRLAEILGAKALALDEAQRAVDVGGIAQRQLRALEPKDRAALGAFSDGVNAAATTQPLPIEFRMLLYRPARWTPKDSLAVSIVASLELADSWHAVLARDAVWRHRGARCFALLFPLSDPRYDVTIDGRRDARPNPTPQNGCSDSELAERSQRPIGSNAWAAGSARTVDGRAILANDPHLDVTIPGIWYLIDLQAPGLHTAGATIPGLPGVVLGHNERLAWASTNAEMATTSLFETGHLHPESWVVERFGVRFSHTVRAAYYRTAREFSVPSDNDRSSIVLVRWPIYAQKRSTIATALELDRARSIGEAQNILSKYRGSPQNFVVADSSGNLAYHVAGLVPDDPAWGRYVHPAADLRKTFVSLAFAQLPGRKPARDAILLSANNKAYGSGYSYRLSAQFEPPYRAYRIAQLLAMRRHYDVAYFARMQLDTLSPIDLEIARDVLRFARAHPAETSDEKALAALEEWNGRYDPGSLAATLEHALRLELVENPVALRARLSDPRSEGAEFEIEQDLGGALSFGARERRVWRDAGGMRIEHPLAPMNFAFLNGAWLPGAGDEYTIHLQEPGFGQGFRAVWDVGDWDRGGISIPSGESGEPGSGHYTDLTRAWVEGLLEPLPFSGAAIGRSASAVLVLRPDVRVELRSRRDL
ncbi:MAG: penicillin acylase family protein [Candidatus Cybelea sp.]